ncbi:MAG: threonine/serine exporter family protein [Clostridia bacterium]|nr:threonine/serine exporter family protein [Clostridia bacterium]
MDFREVMTIVLSGMLGTIGFSILFKSDKKRILCNAVGGALTCLIYMISCHYFGHIVVQNFLPAIFATIYAEVLARIVKAPATPILACSIISLVPGGKLYYTMYYFVTSDPQKADLLLSETLQISAGLAVGIICISVIVHELNRHKAKKILEVD